MRLGQQYHFLLCIKKRLVSCIFDEVNNTECAQKKMLKVNVVRNMSVEIFRKSRNLTQSLSISSIFYRVILTEIRFSVRVCWKARKECWQLLKGSNTYDLFVTFFISFLHSTTCLRVCWTFVLRPWLRRD